MGEGLALHCECVAPSSMLAACVVSLGALRGHRHCLESEAGMSGPGGEGCRESRAQGCICAFLGAGLGQRVADSNPGDSLTTAQSQAWERMGLTSLSAAAAAGRTVPPGALGKNRGHSGE